MAGIEPVAAALRGWRCDVRTGGDVYRRRCVCQPSLFGCCGTGADVRAGGSIALGLLGADRETLTEGSGG